MTIRENGLNYYIDRLQRKDYFSLPGYGDSEWLSITGTNIGSLSGLGQLHSEKIGAMLRKTLRTPDPTYLRATAKIIQTLPVWDNIQKYIREHHEADGDYYERDMITDDLAAAGGLYPLIEQLRKMHVVLIGNPSLENIDFLNVQKFIPISTPNFYEEMYGIKWVVREILEYNQPAVYIFSAGMSAAVMIRELHGKIPGSFLLDLGSMFDAFTGAGAQRQWRRDLYTHPEQYETWLKKCLRDIPSKAYENINKYV